MAKIKKVDIKNNSYYFKTIIFYTILIAIVYGSLCYVKLSKIKNPNTVLFTCITAGSILLIGFVIEILFLLHQAKKREAGTNNNIEEK
jgi:hypothetical protein